MLLANLATWKECTIYVAQTVCLFRGAYTFCLCKLNPLPSLQSASLSPAILIISGADTCNSPAPRPVVNRTFEGIVLSPEASLSPDTTSNSRPLTRKRRAEISPVIDQPGALHMQACLSYLAPLDASPCCAWSACLVWSNEFAT